MANFYASYPAGSGGGGGGVGTVTSVGLADGSTTPIYTVSGSPVTTAGTLTITLANQAANTIFAGPTAGGAAEPAFRALVAADIPSGLFWSLAGNAGTTPGTDFLGTTDAISLEVRTNNTPRLNISATGAYTLTPNEVFVNGTIGAVAGTYNSLLVSQNFSSTIANNYYGGFLAPTFDGIVSGVFTGHSLNDQWHTGSGVGGWIGYAVNPDFQAGSVIGNVQAITINPQFAAGTLLGSSYSGVGAGGTFASDFQNYVGLSNNPTFSSVMNGGNGISDSSQFQAGASVPSYTSANLTPSFQAGSSVVGLTGINVNSQVAAGSAVTNYVGATLNSSINVPFSSYQGLQLNNTGTGSVTNYEEFNVSSNSSGNITNYTMLNGSPNHTGTITNVTGGKFDVTNLSSPNQKIALTAGGGASNLFSPIDTSVMAISTPFINNIITGNLTIASGFPISGPYGFGNSIGFGVDFQDDMGPDVTTLGLGYSMNGFITQVTGAGGKTFDTLNFMAAAAGVPPASTGGTITNVNIYRALGLVPSGGTLAVTNMIGFKGESLLDAISATNLWGVRIDATTADNWFAKNVVVGGGTMHPSNASVGLELAGTTQALLPSRLTTVQRDALTALAGMTVYNTTTTTLQYYNGAVWVDSSAGAGTVTSVSVVTANGVSGSVATATTTPAITLTLGAITPSSVAAVGTVTGSNLSGTNTGDVTLAAVGAVPNANAASLTGQVLNLQPFDSTNPGVVTASGGGAVNFLRADGTWAAPAGSGGTVTSVSVVTANGVSGSVATATTTPAITLTLGAITPSSVAAVGTVTGSNLSGTNTGDITVTAFGAAPSASGFSLTGQALTLEPFDSTHPGAVTASGGGAVNFLRADGTWATPPGTATGTVTSVALTVPGFLSVAGSPVTTSGTLAVTLATQSANLVFAGPASGAAAAPTFRSLVVADMTIANQAIAATTIDWSAGNGFSKTLSANTTFTFSNQLSGQTLIVRLTNTASNYTVTWPTVRWPGGTPPVMTIGAFSDVYTFYYDGSDTYGSYVQNMS